MTKSEKKAYKEGWEYCRKVKGDIAKYEYSYPIGSEEHIAWARGWHDCFEKYFKGKNPLKPGENQN